MASVLEIPVDHRAVTLPARTAMFAAYSLCVGLAHLPVLRALYEYSRLNETASHVILIPFVTLVLVYQNRASVFANHRVAWQAGLGVTLAGWALAVAAWAYGSSLGAEESLAFAVAAVVVLWLGGFLLFYGWPSFHAALFPLLFLGFTIPIPAFVLDIVIGFLRTGSTAAVEGLFTLTGTPYLRAGFVFELPGVVIEVAEECSGIRSRLALLLTGLLAGHLCLRTGWKKAVLVAAALPLTIVKNGIRIVSLSLLAVHVDTGFLTGQLHHDGGVVFFLLTLAMMAPILAWLRYSESAGAKSS